MALLSNINNAAQVAEHIGNTDNPHKTTLEQARSEGNQVAGDIDMGGNRVVNVPLPVDSGDAVPRQFVDDQGIVWVEDEYTTVAAQVTFVLSNVPADVNTLELYVNGVLYDDDTNYVLSGTTVTWLNVPFPMDAGDKIHIRYAVKAGFGTSVSPHTTQEEITLEVDESNASAAIILPGLAAFTTQAEWDDALGGASSFRYLSQVLLQVSRATVKHRLRINVSGAPQHPDPAEPGFGAFTIPAIHVIPPGSVSVYGSTAYTATNPGGAVVAFQTGSGDPYVECAPGTFPTDGSLEGEYAVIDTGGADTTRIKIHEHTDARLRLTIPYSGTPVSVSVGLPSSRLRNSLDDATSFRNITLTVQRPQGRLGMDFLAPDSEQGVINFFDLTLEHAGGSVSALNGFHNCAMNFERVHVRHEGFASQNGRGFQLIGYGDVRFRNCGVTGSSGFVDDAFFMNLFGDLQSVGCVFKGCDESLIFMQGNVFFLSGSVFIDGIGDTEEIALFDAELRTHGIGGPSLEFRNCSKGALYLERVRTRIQQGTQMQFLAKDCGDSPIRLGPGTHMDIRQSAGFIDGGGNVGHGFVVEGPHALLRVDNTTNLQGSSGEIVDADGNTLTYAAIKVAKATDSSFNVMSD